VHPEAKVATDALLDAPHYIGRGCEVRSGARIGPGTVLVADVLVASKARIDHSILWAGSRVEEDAAVSDCVLGPGVRIGRCASARAATLGEGTVISDFSRIEGASAA
jgi:NDP-sugar pyrophosphorylase family protein